MAALLPVLLLDAHLQPQPASARGPRSAGPRRAGVKAASFSSQAWCVFRERGRDAAPRVLEEAGDGSQVGTERAEFPRAVVFVPAQDAGDSKPCHTPPAATPPGSRGPRLGRAVGGLRGWAGACPAWSRRGVRRAAGARRARPRAAACAAAGRSIRAAADGHPARRSAPDRVPVHREQLRVLQPREGQVPLRLAHADERLGQAGDGGRFQQRVQAVGGRGPVEQAEQPQDGEGALALRLRRRSRTTARTHP